MITTNITVLTSNEVSSVAGDQNTALNPTNQISVTLLSTGFVGPKGDTGATGPAGVKGDQGDPGINGKRVEILNNGTNITWRYVGDTSWNTLVSLASLRGPTGLTGTAAKDIQLQASGSHIQWRYVGDESWTNLVALAAITGPTGPQGSQGIQGIQGIQGEPAPQQIYVQNTQPAATGQPYVWLQTGLPGGGTTLWIDDGV